MLSERVAGEPALLADGRRRQLCVLIAIGFGQGAVAVSVALLVKAAFHHLLSSHPSVPGALAGGLVAAAIIAGWLRVRERVTAERFGQSYATAVRLALHRQMTKTPVRILQQRSHGGVLLRFVGDVNALRQWLSLGLARLVVSGTAIPIALSVLAVMNMAVAASFASALLAGTAASLWLGRRLEPAVADTRRRRARLAASVSQQISALAVVQAFGQVSRERRQVRRESRRLADAMVNRSAMVGRLQGVNDATVVLATTAVLFVGANEARQGRLEPGALVGVMTVVGLLVAPLRDLARAQEYWRASRVARAKLREFLALPTLIGDAPGAPRLKPGAGLLEFDAITVAGSLCEVSATAHVGERVAVVGPNGAGKSTLLAVAARLVDADTGRVRLDGQDLTDCRLASVRRVIGLAGPELPLVRGTVETNLRYRWPDAPPEELERVADLCDLGDLLARLPDGLDTRIADCGRNLSAGQALRLGLARALVGGPALLLLDEVDASLDPRTAAVLDRVIDQHVGAVIVVTHRIERVRRSDVVWHMDAGRLLACGPPDQLLTGPGPTADLFAASAATGLHL